MPLQFVASTKGKNLLLHDGFLFRKERETQFKEIWRCIKNQSFKCPARCHTAEGFVIFNLHEHNHVPDMAEIECRTIINEAKEQASGSQASSHQILAVVTEGATTAACGRLPQATIIKKSIQRTRQRKGAAPAIPLSLETLIVPEEYRKHAGEDFLLFDSGLINERILIFSTKRNLKVLLNSEHWYADGTFKVVPPLFQQLYTIHGVHYDAIIPLIYALTPNKKQATYQSVLDALKTLQPDLTPATIMVDFERSAINAFENAFPSTTLRGCYFHLSQCIWRRIQSCPDVFEKYKSDPDFALGVRNIPALAFLPANHVERAFEEMQNFPFFVQNMNILQPIMDYFEDCWIGRPRAGGRRPPKFSIELWNCHVATLEGLPRTNNSVEGWHRRFSGLVAAAHPTIWKFIVALQKEQSMNDFIINQLIAGERPSLSKKSIEIAQEELKKLLLNMEQGH